LNKGAYLLNKNQNIIIYVGFWIGTKIKKKRNLQTKYERRW
jgi:hypothetical protein